MLSVNDGILRNCLWQQMYQVFSVCFERHTDFYGTFAAPFKVSLTTGFKEVNFFDGRIPLFKLLLCVNASHRPTLTMVLQIQTQRILYPKVWNNRQLDALIMWVGTRPSGCRRCPRCRRSPGRSPAGSVPCAPGAPPGCVRSVLHSSRCRRASETDWRRQGAASAWSHKPSGTPTKYCTDTLEFFPKLNSNSVNSANSENLINHWCMNWAQFKDLVSHMCLAGTVVACWFVTQEVAGTNTLFCKNIFQVLQIL